MNLNDDIEDRLELLRNRTHGGKRKGAGRPVEEIKRVMVAVRLPPDLVEKLRKVEDQTALIESLLRDYFESPE